MSMSDIPEISLDGTKLIRWSADGRTFDRVGYVDELFADLKRFVLNHATSEDAERLLPFVNALELRVHRR